MCRGGIAGQNTSKGRLWLLGDSSHASYIQSEHTGSGNTQLTFGTVIGNALPTERMRIDRNGNVAIQTSGQGIGIGFMETGSLTIGNTTQNYGGGNGWTANTSGLLMECLDNTAIAVHDSGITLHSFMRYTTNGNFRIGRNMGNGVANVTFSNNVNIDNELLVSGNKLVITGISPTLYLRDTNERTGMIHMNGNIMYFLSGVANSDNWTQVNCQWPLTLNTVNNAANFGGTVTIPNTLNVGGETNLRRDTYIASGNESTNIGLYFSTPFTGIPTQASKSGIVSEAITNHSRHHLVICLNRVNNNNWNVGTADAYMRFHQDDYIDVFKQLRVYNEIFAGFTEVGMSNTDYLCVQQNYTSGQYNTNWIRVAFGSFTAFHRCYTDDELYNNETDENIDLFKNNYMGRVVIATGKIKTDFSRKKEHEDTSDAIKPTKRLDGEPEEGIAEQEENEWYTQIDKDGISIEDAIPVVQLSRKK
jgi:hypothetical protein